MNRFLVAAATALLLAGCASSSWKENEFYLGGRKVALSDAQMQSLRSAWSAPVPYAQMSTTLTPAEARWTADFIAFAEGLRDRANPCRRLILESIAPSSPSVVDLTGRHAAASRFDETWKVTACGTKRAYRAYHPEYSTALAVEEVRL